jgi:hypothetical protein
MGGTGVSPVGQERRPARAGRLPGLPAARRHPDRAEPGPAIPGAGQPDRNRRHAAPAWCRVQEPARGPGDHHHPGGWLVFHVFAALAEFIRELIVEGTHEGLDAARTRGTRLAGPRP